MFRPLSHGSPPRNLRPSIRFPPPLLLSPFIFPFRFPAFPAFPLCQRAPRCPTGCLRQAMSFHSIPRSVHRSPVTSHRSPVTSHQSPVTSHQSVFVASPCRSSGHRTPRIVGSDSTAREAGRRCASRGSTGRAPHDTAKRKAHAGKLAMSWLLPWLRRPRLPNRRRQCGGTRPPGAFPAGRVCFAAGWRALSPAEACAERPLHHAFSDAQIGRRTDLEVRRVCTCAAKRFRRVTGNSTRVACSTREAPLQRTATGPRSHDRSHFAQPSLHLPLHLPLVAGRGGGVVLRPPRMNPLITVS